MEPFFVSLPEVVRFALVLFRVAGIMVFAPFFNSQSVPFQVKVVIALVVTLSLAPVVPLQHIPAEFGLGQIITSILGQTIFGLVLGLTATFIFAGLQLAGQIIGFQLGFSIVNLIDPQSQVESSVISLFQNFIGMIFFLLINGHHWFFLAVSDSFNYLPVDGVRLHGSMVQEVIRLSSRILVSGLQIAGPVIAVTLIADIVLGIISRAAPQIHILIVGMPLKTLVGFACLSVAFYFLPQLLGGYYVQLFKDMFSLLRQMG